MKKELLILLQFILIADVIGSIVFGKFLFEVSNFASAESVTVYKLILINWTLMFVILGFIRFPFACLISYFRVQNLGKISKKIVFKDNIVKTIQYLALAIISVLTPMWIVDFRFKDGLDLNEITIFKLWWFFRDDVFLWLGIFFVLSLIRLAFIYAREKSVDKVR